MKAWRIHKPGDWSTFTLDDIDPPECRPGDVLVRIRAIGLNSSEMQLIRGDWEGPDRHVGRPLPLIPGIEAAGEVVAVGREVTTHHVGDRVTVQYLQVCGVCDECLGGWENTCANRLQFGRTTNGAYCEIARMPAPFAIHIPDEVSFEAAAALTCTGGTSWHMLMRHAVLEADEWVLVTGGASGIGTVGIQVARIAGARVIATAGSDAKLDRLREMGVDHLINHTTTPDFAAQVREITGGRGVDVVYEVPGRATFGPALASMRPRGRLIIGGYMSGMVADLDLLLAIQKELRIFGSATWSRPTLRHVMDLTARGELTPILDSVLPFEQLPDGLHRLDDRSSFGKVVVSGPS